MEKKEKKHIVLLVLGSVLAIIVVPIYVFFGIPLLLLVFEGDNTGSVDNIPKYLNDKIGIAIKDCKVVKNEEKRAGNGDGDIVIILDCENNSLNFRNNDWKKLSLTKNIELRIYGGEKDGIRYEGSISEDYDIPVISNGYYYFVDKQNKKSEKHNDKYLLDDERYSYNYYIAIYDLDTDKLYYIEEDT